MPAMTERHLAIFVSARAKLVASWAAARLSNARWSWPIAYDGEAAMRGSSGIRYLIPHHANPGQTWRQDSNLRPPGLQPGALPLSYSKTARHRTPPPGRSTWRQDSNLRPPGPSRGLCR